MGYKAEWGLLSCCKGRVLGGDRQEACSRRPAAAAARLTVRLPHSEPVCMQDQEDDRMGIGDWQSCRLRERK